MLDPQLALWFFSFMKKQCQFHRKLMEFYKTRTNRLPKHMTITSRNKGLAKDSILTRIIVVVK